ncbi:MAG: FTR1 family protein [Selenomonadaceae bacterium]
MEASGESLFWIALMIVVREGTEAALIVAAIVAYLRRAGYDEYISRVRTWVNVAIVCCFLTAYVLIAFVNGIGLSQNQHLVKAIASFMAVAVLLPMCDWVQGRASASKWKTYINGMVHGTLVGSRRYALAMATFLAVYREGVEIILFYQALSADLYDSGWGEISLGFSVGVIVIAAIFLLIYYGALRIPLTRFFQLSCALIFLLIIRFIGCGIAELQHIGYVSATAMTFLPTIELLGIFPTYETFIPQALFAVMEMVRLWRREIR